MTWQHSLHSEQENQDPSWFAAGKLPPFYESEDAAGSLTQAPFQFHAHRSRIDWRVLHGVDVDEVVSSLKSCSCLMQLAISCSAPKVNLYLSGLQTYSLLGCMRRLKVRLKRCAVISAAQVRRTDIDTLERCVNAIAFGDIEAEGPGSLTRVNFIRIFRLSQLTVEYLLHVQDRLASEAVRLRVCSSDICIENLLHAFHPCIASS